MRMQILKKARSGFTWCLLGLVAIMVASLTSCSETEETDTEYADWQSRNEAFFTTQYAKGSASGGTWRNIVSYSKNPQSLEPTDRIVMERLTDGDGVTYPAFTDSVAVHYEGRLMPTDEHPQGLVFDSSWSGDYNPATMTPTRFAASGLVDGFATALMHMSVGERCRVYIPYQLGYGTQAQSAIPAFSTLVFDITLVRVWQKRL